MFDNLTQKLTQTFKNLRGQGRLSEDNIRDALRDVRLALLEADVALLVVKDFIQNVREQAMGEAVAKSLTPGQVFVKIVHDELVQLMGARNDRLDLSARPPAVILLAGLQGSGKTTTSAKLALWLKDKEKKRVLMVSTDVYRPAAMEQLAHLGKDIAVDVFPASADQQPVRIAQDAVAAAQRGVYDVLIVDTAGRLHVDGEMMAEAQALTAATQPVELLFVVDAMTGQDAVNTAKAFNDALPLTGVILTKADGDARGGADIILTQPPMAAQILEGLSEFLGQIVKHGSSPPRVGVDFGLYGTIAQCVTSRLLPHGWIIELMPALPPVGHELIHQRLETVVMRRLQQVGHFMDQYVFQTAGRPFGQFGVEADVMVAGIATPPAGLHLPHKQTPHPHPHHRRPCCDEGRHGLTHLLSIPRIQQRAAAFMATTRTQLQQQPVVL